MPTRNVVLTNHQTDLIKTLVSSGRYQNASEVLREGIRLIEKQEAEDNARIASLREAAHAGLTDIEAGQFKIFEEPAVLRGHLAALTDDAIADRDPVRKK
jgi:antitoxin ParD1/3/4